MSLDEQDAVVTAIAGYFDDLGWRTSTTDYRSGGGHSGYRAVHVVVERSPLGKVERQIRTHLQGQWANMYEAMADRIGRFIRYDGLPLSPEEREHVEFVQKYSSVTIARLERLMSRLSTVLDQDGADRHDPSVAALSAEVAELEADLLRAVQRIEDSLR